MRLSATRLRVTSNGGGRSFDANARSYIAAVEAADGQALEAGVKTAINAFVVGCKADGIWDAIKASCILSGARTLSGALVPLAGTGPTNFNFVSGDYNRKTGLVGDGTSKYLNSNRASNASPQNLTHHSIYVTSGGTTTSNRAHIGTPFTSSDADYNDVFAVNDNRLILRCRNGNGDSQNIFASPAGSSTGLIGASRASSTGFTIRFTASNYSVSGGAGGPSYAPSAGNYAIFARLGTPPTFYSNARLAFYSIGESLDLALLDARVTTLISAYAAALP
jgi:hypothetical protein